LHDNDNDPRGRVVRQNAAHKQRSRSPARLGSDDDSLVLVPDHEPRTSCVAREDSLHGAFVGQLGLDCVAHRR
jgi:hypothetical protein